MKISAGILVFKKEKNENLYFLVHPGSPFGKIRMQKPGRSPKEKFYPMKTSWKAP
ncbi:hypothetical protein [Chryseobacterium wanjuense]